MLHAIAFGIASWYSRESSGWITASGLPMVDSQHICATRRLVPYGTRLVLVNRANGLRSWCIVEDYGPARPDRIIDVSPAVRDDLGFSGLTEVTIYR